MNSGERGSARTDYTISLAFAGVLTAVAIPEIQRPHPVNAGLVRLAWPWLLLIGAVAILAFAARTWWLERRRG